MNNDTFFVAGLLIGSVSSVAIEAAKAWRAGHRGVVLVTQIAKRWISAVLVTMILLMVYEALKSVLS
jgi:hypothetical protein